MAHTTPSTITWQAEILIRSLGLAPERALWLDLSPADHFTPETLNCVLNVMCQIRYMGGSSVFGWVIWQDIIRQFTEAEFHCVWKSTEGHVYDITPRVDGELQICFIPDPDRNAICDVHARHPVTQTYSNVRMLDGVFVNDVRPVSIVLTKDALLKHLKK